MALPKPETRSGAGPSDAALVLAARAGEAWAQEALFRRYARMVNALAHRLLANPAEADDLVQDAFIQALSSLDRLQNPEVLASWLGSIVVRTAHKRLRRQRLMTRLGLRRNEPVDLDAVVASQAPPDVVAEARAAYAVIDQLPPEERIAFVLRRVEGMTIAEAAERMGKSVATVKRRLASAEQKLEWLAASEPNARVGAGVDAGADAGADAAVDTGADAGVDAGGRDE